MKKIAFFDTKPYDRTYFDKYGKDYEITYFEEKLNHHTAKITEGFDGVCAFVNSNINKMAIERMHERGVKILAMRCAGFSNVDIAAAAGKLAVVRVPAYSPHAVAEHALALISAHATSISTSTDLPVSICTAKRPVSSEQERSGAPLSTYAADSA